MLSFSTSKRLKKKKKNDQPGVSEKTDPDDGKRTYF